MTDFRVQFDQIFANLHQTKMFGDMAAIKENSPWHREDNILLHTQMVVAAYRARVNVDGTKPWTRSDFHGALAAAFHDVGKPSAMIKKNKPDRGDYLAFHGHELVSARMWEDYAVQHFLPAGIVTAYEIYTIGWMIEHHVPWAITAKDKCAQLARTAVHVGRETFVNVLMADQRGRISDGQDLKLRDVDSWLAKFDQTCDELLPWGAIAPNTPTLYVPIGASGCGKSTFQRTLKSPYEYFSLDALRHELYDANDYERAWKMSDEDPTFIPQAHARFHAQVALRKDLYVDNTNISKKRRAFYVNTARQLGYHAVAVLFPIALETIIARQLTREDKTVPIHAVRNQYNNLQYPFVGEFDRVIVVDPLDPPAA